MLEWIENSLVRVMYEEREGERSEVRGGWEREGRGLDAGRPGTGGARGGGRRRARAGRGRTLRC
jgi:hypothetical protein